MTLSTVEQVPEPSTLALFGTGVLSGCDPPSDCITFFWVVGQFDQRVPQRLKPQLIFSVVYGTAEAVPLSRTLKLTHYLLLSCFRQSRLLRGGFFWGVERIESFIAIKPGKRWEEAGHPTIRARCN